MQIIMNTGGIAATNCYLVADEESGEAVLFDAPNDTVSPLLEELEKRNWRLIGLWLTHGHFDHLADHAVATQHHPDAKVLIHPLDEPKLTNPGSSIFPLPFVIPPRRPDRLVEDGETLSIGSLRVQVIHTPGHSPGHVMYHFPGQHTLIGGDLIIMGAVGRTDLPDASQDELDASIRKVMKLPEQTSLLPGHGHPSTLGDERRTNPYVQAALGM